MNQTFHLADPSFFVIQPWRNVEGLTAGFTTRNGGVGKQAFKSNNLAFHVEDDSKTVKTNRERLSLKLNFPLQDWVSAKQVHEASILEVKSSHRGQGATELTSALPNIDGYWTKEKNILLTSAYADCIPLYFLHKNSNKIGLAHAGWKGTAAGIGINLLKEWEKEGIQPSEVEVVIGPGICSACYEVDTKVIQAMDSWLDAKNRNNLIKQTSESHFHIDLSGINELQLINHGVNPSFIYRTNFCTCCDDLFFSHRRDQGTTGRMLSFIGWKV
ncbi:peptidoglycan editing factor PgeF [Mangrovibacillus cuniculi]|uniref:Purine nucleoside phosphorylase n=1 Tax=Mangrovibacillus cuniculi TaxID=2593652 RepID=A0A7S8HEZ2_9BACI|nr:peptidoglycan editing factor PgeF [Mangrovibacillus cuniculi]QPC46268.1 peptidoglycan editing factor PgeF [Mangrovibacillus cuniculi]